MIIPNINRETFDTLYNGVKSNISRYRAGDGNWLYSFWKEKGYEVDQRGLEVNLVELDPSKDDIDNAIALYEGLDISPMIASSGLFWTIFAHYELPFLLKKRPLTGNDSEDVATIQKYYLCNWNTKERAIERGLLSRLWWVVELTVDKSRADCYELTREALVQASTAEEILDRSITKSRQITRKVLEYSQLQREQGNPLLREEFRKLLVHLNAIDQTICIDAMEAGELDDAIESFMKWSRERRTKNNGSDEN